MGSVCAKKKNAKKEKLVNELTNKLDLFYDEKIDNQLKNKIKDLDDIYLVEAQGAKIKSRIIWFEKGEKNNLGLKKNNAKRKHIITILKSNGKLTSDNDEILKEQVNFYKKVYTNKEIPENNITEYLQKTIVTKRSRDDYLKCEGLISVEELTNAIFKMQLNKSPGSDGLSVEFYCTFWDNVKDILCKSLNYSYNNNILCNTQRMGIINLLFKSGQRESLENWRLITLLNVDYNIMAHVLSNRIQSVIGSIINNDQKGYINGRFGGESIRLVEDILSYTNDNSKPGAMVFIDFAKAFDSLDRNLLFKTLKKFGFGLSFVKWINLIYRDTQCMVTNNGWTSECFNMNCGVRQRCP